VKASRSGPRHEVLRAGILTASADLFRARGYRAATLDEIARKVGVSKPTLYGYFRSKEELLAAIFHRTMSLFERDLEAIRTGGDDPAEQLRRVIRFHVGAVIAERSFLAVFFGEEANLPPRLGRAIRRRKARYDRTVRMIVNAGVRDGSIRAENPRLLVFALLGMANWVYQWYDPAGAWDADEIAAGFIALLEPGYVVTKHSRARAVDETLTRIEAELMRLRPVLGASRSNGVARAGGPKPLRRRTGRARQRGRARR
jgi:TetR/AcrR family transcriptional regulator, cholesterol catabolism regulator